MANFDASRIHVFVAKDNHHIYSKYANRTKDKPRDFPFASMPDMFVAAACVGGKHDLYERLSGPKTDISLANVFSAEQWVTLYAVAFKRKLDMSEIDDPKKVVETCQNYANGGIVELKDILENTGGLRPLNRFANYLMGEPGI